MQPFANPEEAPPKTSQASRVVAFTSFGAFVWARVKATPISFHQAAKVVALCTLLLALIATLDTLGGFIVGHQRTIPEAFINSGPFGGIMAPLIATRMLTRFTARTANAQTYP